MVRSSIRYRSRYRVVIICLATRFMKLPLHIPGDRRISSHAVYVSLFFSCTTTSCRIKVDPRRSMLVQNTSFEKGHYHTTTCIPLAPCTFGAVYKIRKVSNLNLGGG